MLYYWGVHMLRVQDSLPEVCSEAFESVLPRRPCTYEVGVAPDSETPLRFKLLMCICRHAFVGVHGLVGARGRSSVAPVHLRAEMGPGEDTRQASPIREPPVAAGRCVIWNVGLETVLLQSLGPFWAKLSLPGKAFLPPPGPWSGRESEARPHPGAPWLAFPHSPLCEPPTQPGAGARERQESP